MTIEHENRRPMDCSICKRIDNFLKLTDGCTWLCFRCRGMLGLK
jgi:hypothetical protein